MRPSILAARRQLAEGRQKQRTQHDQGSPGVQVCARLTQLLDDIVLAVWRDALQESPPAERQMLSQRAALVAYGGYGRRDVAPYSDVDLMLLCHPKAQPHIEPLARRLVMDLGDAGLTLGFSVRTPAEACSLAMSDATILTSLAESRPLAGGDELFDRFFEKFKRKAASSWRRLVPVIEESRLEERQKFGETVYLLEPNVKRSCGGLRDLQLIRWLGFVRCGHTDFTSLRRVGALSRSEERSLREATEFLLRLRNEMHFHAGKSQDLLGRAEQPRLAEWLGCKGCEGVLPVERFMQDYFRHTIEIRDIAAHFASSVRPRRVVNALLEPIAAHSVEGDFRVGPQLITATRRQRKRLQGDIAEILRLMDLANLYNKHIDHDTWHDIRLAMMSAGDIEIEEQAIVRFLSLLSQPARLGELLRRLHELRVLEKLIPEFAHARCLLQFNEYHKFTVDAHSIRAVEVCSEFHSHPGRIGQVYRSIQQKRTLHLALLIHDLGKGYVEDHSEVGLRIAAETARRLLLPRQEAEAVKFLVHKHLVMSHLAFRRDTSDEQVLVNFAFEVGTPEVLKMLYVLTCADLGAVGPGVLNDWKLDVLTDLYHRTMVHLAGDASLDGDLRLAQRRNEIRRLAAAGDDDGWLAAQIDALTPSYLRARDSQDVVDDLSRLRQLPAGRRRGLVALLAGIGGRSSTRWALRTMRSGRGLFHRLTGVLAGKRQQVLTAEINTLADGLALDRFYVHDGDYSGPPPQQRLDEVCRVLRDAACDASNTPPRFSQVWEGGRVAGRLCETALTGRV